MYVAKDTYAVWKTCRRGEIVGVLPVVEAKFKFLSAPSDPRYEGS